MIISGVNGAGKSTLFEVYPGLFKNTQRINADEILRSQNGDWRRDSDNLAAMRTEIAAINTAITTNTGFHVETTLAGSGHAQQRFIKRAHDKGFHVTLVYVSLASPTLAIKRVNNRVTKGGHGIPADVIVKRYRQSLQNLPIIASMVDDIRLFDNTHTLKLVYARDSTRALQDALARYDWLPNEQNLRKV